MRVRALPSALFYGWIVIPLTFVAALTTGGIRSAPTVFIEPLEAEFGWSRAAIAAAIGLNLLLYGLGAPLTGRLLDRFGPRRVIPVSLTVLCIAMLATTQVQALWQL